MTRALSLWIDRARECVTDNHDHLYASVCICLGGAYGIFLAIIFFVKSKEAQMRWKGVWRQLRQKKITEERVLWPNPSFHDDTTPSMHNLSLSDAKYGGSIVDRTMMDIINEDFASTHSIFMLRWRTSRLGVCLHV
jgi:hypothetical protein